MSGSKLLKLQRVMARAVMRPLTPSNRMQRSSLAVAQGIIKPNDRLAAFERLEIYNRQYWFRVLDSFFQDFPGVRVILGDKKFTRLAEAYIERHPSVTFTLRNLGSKLETFLRRHREFVVPHAELALDMARFEWAQVEAFDGEACPILEPSDIEGRSPAKIRLKLQPYVTLLELRYPVDDFVLALKKQNAFRSEASNASEESRRSVRTRSLVLPKRARVHVAVHRLDNTLYYKRLEPEAYKILTALQQGATLARAFEHSLKGNKDPQAWIMKIQKWFENWMALGWFCKMDVGMVGTARRAVRLVRPPARNGVRALPKRNE